jgi:poly-gamma-glutamate capsule biosynthesis protein CapA/YwtB (metallophosphatase superfamily)
LKRIGFTGDIALSGIIRDFTKPQIERQLNLNSFSQGSSFIINLESPAVENYENPAKSKGVLLYTKPEVLKWFLQNNSIACVSLANNHILDYGIEGLTSTISVLESTGVPFTGAGFLKSHTDPVFFNHGNERYAVISYVHLKTNPHVEAGLFLNIYDQADIINKINSVKGIADCIIVSLHWGKDYSNYPEKWQVTDARKFIDNGATIIAGHHSHTIQPFERYKNGYIFYNLGSLIFGDFILDGRLRALRISTKESFIPFFEGLSKEPLFITTRELKGNTLTVDNRNVLKWSERKMRIFNLRKSSVILDRAIVLKENFLDRITDIYTGYYRNPFKEIFRSGNIARIKKLIKKQP